MLLALRWSALIITGLLSTAAIEPRAPAGAWFDEVGNEVTIESGLSFEPLKPAARDVAALVSLFASACLDSRVGNDGARPAIQSRADWGFQFLDVDARVSSHARLDGWQAEDVSVTSQLKAWPIAECNVYAARATRDAVSPIAIALNSLLKAQPDKQYRARRADGRKIDGQTVRWSVQGPDGEPRRVYASAFTNRDGEHFLHFGLTEARPK